MHDVAGILTAISWPCVALLALLLLRKSIVRLLARLADRIETADKVTLGPDGLALEGRLAALEIKANLAGAQDGVAQARALVAADSIPADLQALSDRYRAAARAFSEDRLADEMGRLVVGKAVARDLLAGSGEDGLFAALATAVVAQPEPADTARLLRVAAATRRTHVQYRVILAFIELARRQFVTQEQEGDIIKVLTSLKGADDRALQRLIAQAGPIFAKSPP